MPTYEYRCTECGREFPVKISWREKDSVHCPGCGGSNLKELFGKYAISVQSPAGGGEIPAACRTCEAATPT